MNAENSISNQKCHLAPRKNIVVQGMIEFVDLVSKRTMDAGDFSQFENHVYNVKWK